MLRIREPIGHHAVLQRDREIHLSGTAMPRSLIRLRLSHQEGEALASAVVDEAGAWELMLPPQGSGENYQLEITDGTEVLTYEDIAIGDVFFLSGQSNMQLTVNRTLDAFPAEVLKLEDSNIRELRLPLEPSYSEDERLARTYTWESLAPSTIEQMGALGVSLAIHYRDAADVPVGLINAALGGTPIETWLPHELLTEAQVDEYRTYSSALARAVEDRAYAELLKGWEAEAANTPAPVTIPEDKWQPIRMPAMFFDTEFEDTPGVYYLRLRFDLPTAAQSSDKIRLDLGAIKDADLTYLNGQLVGRTDYQFPPRRYQLKPDILREGENELLIRLIVHRGSGGLTPTKFYGLTAEDWQFEFPKDWEIYQAKVQPELPQGRFWDRLPGNCYYNFVEPFMRCHFAALLWYQGESNAGQDNYGSLFRSLIQTYHELFGETVPFIFVQLTSFDDPGRGIREFNWAKLREQQRRALAEPATAMVVSVDVGEPDDLHPQDKWTLGQRSALAVRALYLGENLVYSGPEVIEVSQPTSELIRIRFDQELTLKGTEPDITLVPAGEVLRVEIEGDTLDLHVTAGNYSEVRYQYHNAPEGGYLVNSEGLPASPFVESIK